MKRILFVDDEPKVLQGLQRMLRSMRHEWNMEFAMSGQEALAILSKAQFDVVVTDMRMPGMDGAQLLKEIMKRYPNVVRIVLSGQTDQEAFLSSASVVHQFLSKPCDTESLKTTIARTCSLQYLLRDETLKKLVMQTGSLPSLSDLYVEFIELLKSPNVSIEKIGRIISKDIGMTAKILQLVNSAFYGLRRRISDPAEAAIILGLNTIKALVLSHQLFTQFDQARLPWFSSNSLWKHSFLAGLLAKQIARTENCPEILAEDALAAGMLHDLGIVVLANNLPDKYKKLIQLVRDKNICLREAEQEIFGGTHAEVGAYMIGLWGLADSIVEALAFHHNPGKYPAKGFTLVTAVHVADVLASESCPYEMETASQIDYSYIELIGLTERLSVWRESCKTAENKEDNE